jgi:hypothetical protein
MIPCPACEQTVPFQVANPRLYTVENRESDRRVTGYRWLRGTITDVVPHYYAIWQCPRCLFADFAERVDKEKPDDRHETARGLFLDISIEKRMVLDGLRELVPKGDLDLQGAFAHHLAALLITTLPITEKKIDHSALGRIALRLAWLYREQQGAPTAVTGSPRSSQAIDHLASATERLDRLVKDAGEVIQEIQQEGKRRGLELKLAETPEANPYLAVGDLLEVRLQTLQSDVTSLQMAVLQDQQGRMAPMPAPAPEDAGELEKGLRELRPLWPDLPLNEREALVMALAAFEYAYQFEAGDESVEQSLAQVNLILDILIRLGDLERALEWTSQISRYASDTADELQGRISKGRASQNLTPYDETVINRKIAALGLTRQKAGERRRDILDLMLERDQEKIDRILAENPQLTGPERTKVLVAAGIHDGVLAMVNRNQPGPATASKEGGWFKKLLT